MGSCACLLAETAPLFAQRCLRSLTSTMWNGGGGWGVKCRQGLLPFRLIYFVRAEASPFSLLPLLSSPVPCGLPIPAYAIGNQLQ